MIIRVSAETWNLIKGRGGVSGGREGSFSLLERRIQTLEEGTTASLARIEQALLLIASKK